MKKNKIICALLAGVMSLSVFASCNKGGDNGGNGGNGGNYTPESVKTWEDDPTFSDTNVDLVKNGKTDFVVVHPYTMTSQEKTGVQELTYFFKEATGIDIKTVADTDYVETAASKFISVGETTLFEETGIDLASYNLGSSGYIIKTISDDVYLAGSGVFGSMYACYEFLAYQFNYECFGKDECRLERNVTDKKLVDFDLVDIPAFDYRIAGCGETGEWLKRTRMHTFSDVYVGSWGANEIPPFHNYLELIPKSKYGDHAEWYSPDGSQLCLERDFDGLLDAVTYEVTEWLKKYPNHEIVTFTQEDGGMWCSHCKELYEEMTGEEAGDTGAIPGAEGQISGGANLFYSLQNIRFVNALAKRVKEWNLEYCPERSISVYLFRYGPTYDVPLKADENGKLILDESGNYIFYDEDLEFADNLGVLYCYSFQSTYASDGTQIEQYYNLEEDFKRWNVIADELALWGYMTNFQNYFAPFDALQQLEANVELCVKSNARVFYIMSQFNVSTPVDWGMLESYVTRKLAWNPDLDVAKLINEFFEYYYKDASEVMKKIYNEYTTHMAWISDNNGVNSTVNGQVAMLKTENWSYATLNKFLAMFDEAYATIAQLEQTDPELYNKLYNRITLEGLTFRYMTLKLYPEKFDFNELQTLRNKVISDALSLGVNLAHEHGGIETLFSI